MKIKYIFFDFDGVLAESVNIKTEAFRQMYLPYGLEFSDKVVEHHLANGGISRYEKFKVYNGTWLNEELTSQRIEELAKRFEDLVIQGVSYSPEVKGTSKFLESATEYKKYIITGTPTTEIKTILERRGMSNFFVQAYGSPEKKDFWVGQILNDESISNEECVFIGDALADYEAAKAHDVHFILRETADALNLFEGFTGYRIKDLNDLQQVIDRLEQKKIEIKIEL